MKTNEGGVRTFSFIVYIGEHALQEVKWVGVRLGGHLTDGVFPSGDTLVPQRATLARRALSSRAPPATPLGAHWGSPAFPTIGRKKTPFNPAGNVKMCSVDLGPLVSGELKA